MATLQDIVRAGNTGLSAQQQLMATVSQNLSNTATKGYHRRSVVLGTGPGQPASINITNKDPTGGSVAVIGVTRVDNATQESMLTTEQSNEEYHTQKGTALNDIQSLLSGTGTDSLSTRLQAFWSGWQAVASNPTDVGARGALLEDGASLANAFQDMSKQLTSYRNGLASLDGSGNPTGTIPDVVAQINSLASQIQTLNRQITLAGPSSTAGTNSNTYDLLDERQRLMGDLSKCADVSMASDGTVSLGGQTLVSGNGQTSNALTIASTTGAITFSLNGTTVAPASGDLAAWTEAAASVDAASKHVDTLADTLMTSVNTLTTSGFDLDGNSGVPFFTGSDTDGDGIINASTLAVNPAIHDPANPRNDNPRAIAAAATEAGPGSPNSADGTIAQQVAGLANTTFTALNGETISSQFNGQLAQLGAAINSEKQDATSSTNVVQMLTNSIQQESGVNSDEEMINMITSQRAYQAAAKIVSTTNEMLATVLSMVAPSTV